MGAIDPNEFKIIRDYIEKQCGINLTSEKTYLVETRLTSLMVEQGCKNFTELHSKTVHDASHQLRDKIVDAMTTNETLWFRDKSPYIVLDKVLLPAYATEIRAHTRTKIRIWSAASSTGQEPYSIAILIREYCRRDPSLKPEMFEIVATDISPTVLFLAMAGRYDSIAMSRGMTDEVRDRYFEQSGKVWALTEPVKKMVTFKKLNLQDNFAFLGKLDLIFCRNVLIYFSEEFKKDLLHRMATMLRPSGYLFLGASESLTNYSSEYQMTRYEQGLYYHVK